MIGRVVSIKSAKSATVIVERKATHPLYKKTYKQSKKYFVDDSIGVKLGEIVDFINCKPVSKNKHWRITKVLGKNLTEIVKEELKKEAEHLISEVMPQPEADRPLDEEEKESEPSAKESMQPEKIKEKPAKIVKKGKVKNGTT